VREAEAAPFARMLMRRHFSESMGERDAVQCESAQQAGCGGV
jgi:hypothetical protein